MKFLKQGLCLALLGAGLAAVPATLASQAAAAPSQADNGLAGQLHSQADGNVSIKENAATGRASFVRVTGAQADLLPDVAGNSAAKAAAKADSFVDTYGPLLGAASGELVRTGVSTNSVGWTVSYTQVHDGVPVFGSAIKANLDSGGDLTAVNGFAAPGINVSTKPTFSAAEIGKRAVAFVTADPPTSESGESSADVTGLKAVNTKLVVYRIGFVKGEVGKNVLAWATEVTNGAIRDQLIYDAHTGKILNRWSLGTDAIDRELREASGTPQNPIFTTVWEEGDLFPGTLNVDQQNLVNSSGEAYWFFENVFGRDSYDGEGAKQITVNNDPRINCPNANWNGITTNYCNGVTSDDVVAHEWGHAYTEYTSGLIYQYQSGALNESYSDVWGETVDLVNGREDEGETFATKRPDGGCEPTAPPKLLMTINTPAAQAGPCTPVAAGFSEPFTTTPVNATVVSALDAANPAGPTTTDGCSAYTNAAAVRRQLGVRRPRRLHVPDQGRHGCGRRCRRHRHRQQRRGAATVACGHGARRLLRRHSHPGRRHPLQVGRDGDCHGPGRGHLHPGRLDPLADGREVDGLRGCDPRHVDAHLLQRPRQGDRRRVRL